MIPREKEEKHINHSLKWRFNKNSSVISHREQNGFSSSWFLQGEQARRCKGKLLSFPELPFGISLPSYMQLTQWSFVKVMMFVLGLLTRSVSSAAKSFPASYPHKFIYFSSPDPTAIIRIAFAKEQEQTLMASIDIRSRKHNTEKANICFTFSPITPRVEPKKMFFLPLSLDLLCNIPRR